MKKKLVFYFHQGYKKKTKKQKHEALLKEVVWEKIISALLCQYCVLVLFLCFLMIHSGTVDD